VVIYLYQLNKKQRFDMKKNISNNNLTEIDLAQKVTNLPSTQNEALAEIVRGLYQGKPLLGKGGLLTNLVKDLTLNGITTKTMRTGTGAFELEVPRDRNSSFEPQLIKKRQTILNEELDNKILALYGLGTSYDGIANHLQEIYGVEVSSATISNVTDKLVPMLNEWRTRPVEAIYAVVFLDAMFFKVKQDNKVTTKVLYNIMGINSLGHKEILGF
jgi:transposase-like protein